MPNPVDATRIPTDQRTPKGARLVDMLLRNHMVAQVTRSIPLIVADDSLAYIDSLPDPVKWTHKDFPVMLPHGWCGEWQEKNSPEGSTVALPETPHEAEGWRQIDLKEAEELNLDEAEILEKP